jgi:hypothetical protein
VREGGKGGREGGREPEGGRADYIALFARFDYTGVFNEVVVAGGWKGSRRLTCLEGLVHQLFIGVRNRDVFGV